MHSGLVARLPRLRKLIYDARQDLELDPNLTCSSSPPAYPAHARSTHSSGGSSASSGQQQQPVLSFRHHRPLFLAFLQHCIKHSRGGLCELVVLASPASEQPPLRGSDLLQLLDLHPTGWLSLEIPMPARNNTPGSWGQQQLVVNHLPSDLQQLTLTYHQPASTRAAWDPSCVPLDFSDGWLQPLQRLTHLDLSRSCLSWARGAGGLPLLLHQLGGLPLLCNLNLNLNSAELEVTRTDFWSPLAGLQHLSALELVVCERPKDTNVMVASLGRYLTQLHRLKLDACW